MARIAGVRNQAATMKLIRLAGAPEMHFFSDCEKMPQYNAF